MAARLLRGADTDEVHLSARIIGDVGAEAQPAGGQCRGEDLRQPRLVERWLTRGKLVNLAGVNVNTHDIVPELCHCRGIDAIFP